MVNNARIGVKMYALKNECLSMVIDSIQVASSFSSKFMKSISVAASLLLCPLVDVKSGNF